jgi:hypothetical protein
MPEVSRFRNATGKTIYNYFQSGDDSLLWDCFTIVGLATGEVELSNRSPVWSCQINGVPLDRANMDIAYVRMISSFLSHKGDMWNKYDMHRVTKKLLDREGIVIK